MEDNNNDELTMSRIEIKSLLHEQTKALEKIIEQQIETTVNKTLVGTGSLKRFLKKTEAYRLYGRNAIDRWVSQGLLQSHKDGVSAGVYRIDRFELERVAKHLNYQPVKQNYNSKH